MSSTLNDVRGSIEWRIASEMAKEPSYPVAFQNVPFKPPNNQPWLQMSIRYGDSGYATLVEPGVGFNRQNGVLVVNVFTPVSIGTGANYDIADRIKALFDRANFGGIKFDPASGPNEVSAALLQSGVSVSSALAAAYYQTQLTITFEAYLD
jgi:hypothetical protein